MSLQAGADLAGRNANSSESHSTLNSSAVVGSIKSYICLSVCFSVPYAWPQFCADLDQICHVIFVYPPLVVGSLSSAACTRGLALCVRSIYVAADGWRAPSGNSQLKPRSHQQHCRSNRQRSCQLLRHYCWCGRGFRRHFEGICIAGFSLCLNEHCAGKFRQCRRTNDLESALTKNT